MQQLAGIAWLLSLQTLGELLSRGLSLPLPGPVVGMLLLLPALNSRVVRDAVGACAEFLLAHLSLLFVPVAVGVMAYLPLLAQYGWRLLAVLLLSTWIGLAVTALLLRALTRDADAELR
ncbi:MAG: Antiholin-like protein LrgA [uncultured Ramlibacter sp.]|uniref:Antiholin-like protein LrgA n=1 Tax=uncultured Ramlibacter sp. TaxID=260755 RepID=A0A6J4PTJ2_9BURK|nr:MAG: Antiholin-like protein LrgA [uncultured Ramlibacter sp.]